ncbi:MAG: glycosyltransferase family 4 protein [Xenococcus sp. MO_188.B8]|nr:glycosyltransferase family 4 protein [Xenococcus sp. MO_188.B8]
MKIAFLHPGSRHSYAIPYIYNQSNLLFRVYTDFLIPKGVSKQISGYANLFELKKFSQYLQSRTSYQLSDIYFKTCYLEGLLELAKRRTSKNLYERLIAHTHLINSLSKSMLDDTNNFNVIYSFLMGSLEGFKMMQNKIKILDLIHPPHEFLIPLLEAEYHKFPHWTSAKDFYQNNADNFLIQREKEELELADIVFAPSAIVQSIAEKLMPKYHNKIYLNHYPIPSWVDNYTTKIDIANKQFSSKKDPLKILFVGTVNLRKGVQYLLPALRSLKGMNFKAKIVGSIRIATNKITEYEDICEFTGCLSKKELAEAYKWADIFIFPSIAEGSAGVIYEAMSFGLPILTTIASGSVVRDGVDGFVLKKPDFNSIAAKIEFFNRNRNLLKEMSTKAYERVNEFSWTNSIDKYKILFNQATASIKIS